MLIVSALLYLYGRFIEPRRISVTKLNLSINGYFRSEGRLRAVLLSDLHISNFGEREKNISEKVWNLKPDIIFITGDFIQTGAEPSGAVEFVSRLKAPLGIWGVLGNIDTTTPDRSKLSRQLKEAGIKMMENENYRLKKDGLWFELIGFSLNPEKETIAGLFSITEPGLPKIVLVHWPRLIDTLLPYHPQLLLCGHTHGGQIRLPLIGGYLARLISGTEYDMGLYKDSNTWIYVSRGIGMTSHPIRLFCSPEITLFNLEFRQSPLPDT